MSIPQYMRKISVIIGNDANAIDFSELRITFQIRRGDTQTPNTADIRIYNVAPNTANQAIKEFTRVVLQAGYEGNFGILFDGTIKQARIGRESATDNYVDITAADGDEPYNFATISHSESAGNTPQSSVARFVTEMQKFGLRGATMPTPSTNGAVRGRVFYGAVKDEIRDFAEANNLTWSLQDGVLTFIAKNSWSPSGDAQVVSPSTGLIGVPEVIDRGIGVRTLLNPNFKIGTLIQLESIVNQPRQSLTDSAQADRIFKQLSTARINPNGLYYVMCADHSGDTRGNNWYTDLICLSADALIPPESTTQFTVLPGEAIPRINTKTVQSSP